MESAKPTVEQRWKNASEKKQQNNDIVVGAVWWIFVCVEYSAHIQVEHMRCCELRAP